MVVRLAFYQMPPKTQLSDNTKHLLTPFVFQVAGIRVKLNQFRDEMEQCVLNQEFSKAAELKQQIIELEEQKELLDSQENSFSQTVRSEEKVTYTINFSLCAIPKARKKLKMKRRKNFNLNFRHMH